MCKTGIAIILAIGLLASAAVVVVARDEADPLAPATVTGSLTDIGESSRTSADITAGVVRDGWDETARLELDDPRLSGVWSASVGINRYRPDPDGWPSPAETYTGSVEVENDGGTWSGTLLGCGCASEAKMVELVGTGGYEGLSALLLTTAGPDDGVPVYGVIVVGDLVPELPSR